MNILGWAIPQPFMVSLGKRGCQFVQAVDTADLLSIALTYGRCRKNSSSAIPLIDVVMLNVDGAGINPLFVYQLRTAGYRGPLLIFTGKNGAYRTELLKKGADYAFCIDTRDADLDLELYEALLALIRRVSGQTTSTISLGPFVVDLSAKRVSYGPTGAAVVLSPMGFRLLAYLVLHRGVVCSQDAILASMALSPGVHLASPEVLRVHICKLRESLRAFSPEPIIESVRGDGYHIPHPSSPPKTLALVVSN